MNAETVPDWEKLKGVVAEALGRPETERAAWLDRACNGDDALRRQAAELLGHAPAAAGFLEPPPAPDASLADGTRLGPYRVLRPLGSGGMGDVYLGERADGAFEQRVAIKVIRGLLAGELRDRFLAERQILAQLDHPHVARLLDGGTTADGRPYLVMEHVEGEPIDDFCDRRALAVDARLRLFLKVCEAVQHAHRHLVVHRDLKPSNVLVTADGDPKLLDFGVAKDLGRGKTPRTRLLLPATPEYASPEQLTGGPVTTASDVYALGVVLYELLTGENPFGDAADPFAGRSRAAPPPPPSARVRRLSGDLDHVVLRSLAPDPRERYASVEQLARDLDRYLRGLPLEGRGGVLYRAGKQARRHWKGLAAALAVLALAAFWTRESLERRQLEHETRRVTVLSEDLGQYLIDLFIEADAARTGERSEALERMLDRGRALLDAGAFVDEPLLRASLLGAVGQVERRLGRLKDAEELLRESLELRRRHLRPDHELIGVGCNNLALALRELGRYPEALDLLRETRSILVRSRPPEHPEIATLLNNLAGLEKELGRFDEAIAHYREALEMKRRLEDEYGPAEIANAVKNLGVGLLDAGRLDEAEEALRDALARASRLDAPDPLLRAGVEHYLGRLLRERGDAAGARALLESALATRRELRGDVHRQTLETLLELAFVDEIEGRLDDAEERLRRVVEARRETLGDEHPETEEARVALERVLAGRTTATIR